MVAGNTDVASEIGSGSRKSKVSLKQKGSSSVSLTGTSTSGTLILTIEYVTSNKDSDDVAQAI
jgi:hypothetical protein